MPYDFSLLKQKIKDVEDWLSKELASVRTGRATPAILDSVKVESYGAKVPINHVADCLTENAKTIRITPWDKTQIKEIERALNSADLGVSLSIDVEGLRIVFPELTGERRVALVKILKGKHEEARTSLRRTRDDIWKDIQEKEKSGEISKDQKFRLKDDMQKMVDEASKALDEMVERKEKEILEK